MSATREVLLGSMVLIFFSLFAGVIAYLTKIVLVQNLSVEEYGLFFSVLTFVLFLQVFISLGLPTGLARTTAKYRINEDFGRIKSIIMGSFVIQMGMALLVMIVLFLLSDYLALNYFENEDARWLLVVLSLFFPLNVLRTQLGAIFNGFSQSKYLSLIQFLYNLGIFIIVIIGFYFFSGVSVPMIAYLGGFLVLFLVLVSPLFKTFNIFSVKAEDFKKSNKELLLFSLPLLLTTVGAVFIAYFDTLMLTYFDTLEVVGVYNIVYPTALLLALVGGSIGAALLPVITQLYEKGKKNYITSAFSNLYIYVSFVVLPCIVSFVVLSEYIIRIFFGEEYVIGVIVFNILILGSLFYIFNSIHNQSLIGVGKSTSIMWVYGIGSMSNVILNLILIPLYSLTGAGVATVLSFIVMFVVSWYLLNREVRVVFPVFKFLMLVVCSLSIVLSVYIFWMIDFNMYILTALGLGVGFMLYVGLVLLFRVVDVIEFCTMIGVDLEKEIEKLKKKFFGK